MQMEKKQRGTKRSGKRLRIRSPALKKYGKYIVLLELLAVALTARDLYTAKSPQTELVRPENGDGDEEERLKYRGGDLAGDLSFTVSERKLTKKEEEACIAQAEEEINEKLLGENTSSDEVWRDLSPDTVYADGRVECQYTFEPDDIIDPDGKVNTADLKSAVIGEAEAVLTCGSSSEVYLVPLRFVPPDPGTNEGLAMYIRSALGKADEKGGKTVKVPKQAGGEPIALTKRMDMRGPEFGILAIALVPLFLFAEKRAEKTKIQKRKEELTRDYAVIVSKLALFTGAGIRPREAFRRIAASYGKHLERGRPPSAGYEEVKRTVVEMARGVGENDAYLHLADRTDHKDYRRLALLLTQNLQKGDRYLETELNREESEAFEGRKNQAMRLGEEASTKMVLPMIMLLGAVMIVLLVPAFSGMGL